MSTPKCRVEITRRALYAQVVVTYPGFPPLLTTMDRNVKASSPRIAKLKHQLVHRAMNPDQPDDPALDIESTDEEHEEANSCRHVWSGGHSDDSEWDEERVYCLLCGQDGDA